MNTIPAVSPEAIASLREICPDDGGEFIKEIIQLYVDNTPRCIAELRTSLAKGDVTGFVRAAHTVKGSSANVGAQGLREIAERLELQSRRDGLTKVESLIADCEEEFVRVDAELRKVAAAIS